MMHNILTTHFYQYILFAINYLGFFITKNSTLIIKKKFEGYFLKKFLPKFLRVKFLKKF